MQPFLKHKIEIAFQGQISIKCHPFQADYDFSILHCRFSGGCFWRFRFWPKTLTGLIPQKVQTIHEVTITEKQRNSEIRSTAPLQILSSKQIEQLNVPTGFGCREVFFRGNRKRLRWHWRIEKPFLFVVWEEIIPL